MIQIRCILVISMVAGLFVANCNSLFLSDSCTQINDKEQDDDLNVAKRLIFCTNPNSKNPHYEHAVYFGERRRIRKNKRLWSKKYRKPSPRGKTPSVVQAVYPMSNSYSIFEDISLTYIQVEYYLNRDKQIYEDAVSIVDGGIGKNFVKINMTSSNPKPTKYKVIIYGKFK